MSDILYCRGCGKIMQTFVRGVDHYDRETGEPVYKAVRKCYYGKGGIFGLFNLHDYWTGTINSNYEFVLDAKYFSW